MSVQRAVSAALARLHEEGLKRFNARHESAEEASDFVLDKKDCATIKAYIDGGLPLSIDIFGSSLARRLKYSRCNHLL